MGISNHGSVFVILVLLHTNDAEYGDRIKNATETWGPNLEMQESRYPSYAFVQPVTDLPTTFQAPYINAKNYWNAPDRRTLFNYDQSFTQDLFTRPITEGLNTFYGIMNQFFGTPEPEDPRSGSTNRQRYPYEFNGYRPPKPQYIPGPKPLRASVIKLEPPRHSSHFPYQPIEQTTTKYYPQFVKLLNDVLIENAYKGQQQPNFEFGGEPPVIEKPNFPFENIVPTTYKPKYKFKTTSTTEFPFPGSIQDKLPPLPLGQDPRIPYVSETTTTTHATVNNLAEVTTSGSRIVFPVPTERVPQSDLTIDVKNNGQHSVSSEIPVSSTTKITLPSTTTNTPQLYQNGVVVVTPTTNITELHINSNQSTNVFQPTTIPPSSEVVGVVTTQNSIEVTTTEPIVDNTTESTPNFNESSNTPPLLMQPSENRPIVTELLQTMEPLQIDRFHGRFPMKLQLQKVTDNVENSADYVTELTLRGLMDNKNVTNTKTTMARAIHVVNKTVIGYGDKNILFKEKDEEFDDKIPTPRSWNLDNEFSLDAKILRDTNWDGFQPPLPTTELTKHEVTTLKPTDNLPTTTTEFITTQTTMWTTDAPTTLSTPRIENHTAVISTRVTQSVSRSLRPVTRRRTSTENPTATENPTEGNEITTVKSARRGRKYQRRPIVQTFTPYPQPEDAEASTKSLHLGSLSRPFYGKRNKPNITLTFGARRRIDDSVGQQSIQLSNQLDKGTRRDLYKKRKFPSQLRRRTTEETPTSN